MCLLIDSRLGPQPTAHSSWSVNSLSYMLMDLPWKWPAPTMPKKNSSVQRADKQSCVHVAPAVLFISVPQLGMHFDDSHFFYFFFPYASLKMHDIQNSNLFREIFGGHCDIMLSRNVLEIKVHPIKYWLYVPFSWFNKPPVMQQCLLLLNHLLSPPLKSFSLCL